MELLEQLIQDNLYIHIESKKEYIFIEQKDIKIILLDIEANTIISIFKFLFEDKFKKKTTYDRITKDKFLLGIINKKRR